MTLVIGPFRLSSPAVQAALSGYSDLAMRRVARAYGAPYALHEVVVDRIVLEDGGLVRRLRVPGEDHPVGGQLMGAEPEGCARAAAAMLEAGYDVIDVNFGCPVAKVLGRRRGGYLLGRPDRALEILRAVIDAVGGRAPVTVKMRRGLDDTAGSRRAFFTVLEGAVAAGVAAVTVHPRTVRQRYQGPSDWSFLRDVVGALGERRPISILGSGDLFGAEDVLRMLETTGVDGVSIARGCIGNPWIFGQVRDLLAGREPRFPDLAEQARAIRMHHAFAVEIYGPDRAVGRTRHHAIKYARLHPDPVTVRDAFVSVRTAVDLSAVLERHYDAAVPAGRSTAGAGMVDVSPRAHGADGGRLAGSPGAESAAGR